MAILGLAVWAWLSPVAGRLAGASGFDSPGLAIGEETVVFAGGPGQAIRGTPHVAFGEGGYLVVWREGWNGEGGGARVCAARTDARGRLLDSKPIALAAGKDGWQEVPRVAFGGGVYLIVWQDFRNGKDSDVLATRVSPAGRVLDSPPIVIADNARTQAAPEVASDGKGFLVAWQGIRGEENACRILLAPVSAEGRLGRPREIESPWTHAGACPKLAWDGTQYWAAYLAQNLLCCGVGHPEVVSQSREKERSDSRPIPLREHLGTATGFAHAVAAAPGKGMLAVFPRSQPDYWGWGGPGAMICRLVGPDSKIAPGMPKEDYPQTKLANWLDFGKEKQDGRPWPYGQSAVAWDGKHFVAVWQRLHVKKLVSLENSDLFASRIDGWKPLDEPGVAVAASDQEEKNPALASDGAGQLLCVYEKHDRDGNVAIVARVMKPR